MVNRIPVPPPSALKPVEQQQQTPDPRRTGLFPDLLRQRMQTGKLTFSSHATARLNQRNIQLSPEDIQRLESAVDRVAQKGGRESLIAMDNVAYVVSVQNRTVITAMDDQQAKDNVFTNIDSAMFVR